jgi:hypothetical protein
MRRATPRSRTSSVRPLLSACRETSPNSPSCRWPLRAPVRRPAALRDRRLIETSRRPCRHPWARRSRWCPSRAAGRHSHRAGTRAEETARWVRRPWRRRARSAATRAGGGTPGVRCYRIEIPYGRHAKRRYPAPRRTDAHHGPHRWRRRPGDGVEPRRGWPARRERDRPAAPRATFVLLAGVRRVASDLQGRPPRRWRGRSSRLARAPWCGAPGGASTAADRYVLALYESLAEGTPIAGAVRAAKLRLMADGLGPSAGSVRTRGGRPAPASAAAPGRLAALVAGGGCRGGLAHLVDGASAPPPAA